MQALLAAIAVGVLANLFITAILVMTTVRMVAGFWPGFWRALLCSVILFILTLTVSLALRPIVGEGNGWAPTSAIMLILNAVVVNGLVRRPDGTPIGWVMAGLAALIQLTMEILLLTLFVIALGISLWEAIQHLH